jgi:predicted alpha/beta-hydrolase family hydrolase
MATFRIRVDATRSVSALLMEPRGATACLVLAHGAGAGMTHPFMDAAAQGLAARRIATLRYQFPYMEQGSKRPDSAPLAQATVRAAVAEANRRLAGLPLFAGGKSFGGRMTSQAHAQAPLDEVRGLVFFGFPLHAAGKPSDQRAAHLFQVAVPMLFLQGSKDKLAELTLLEPMLHKLRRKTSLHIVTDADHSFHVPARSGRRDADVMAEILDAVAAWAGKLIGAEVLNAKR